MASASAAVVFVGGVSEAPLAGFRVVTGSLRFAASAADESAVHAVERNTWWARWNSGEKPGRRLGCLLPAGCSGDSTIAAPRRLGQVRSRQEKAQVRGSGGTAGSSVTEPGPTRTGTPAGDRRPRSRAARRAR